MRVLESVDFHTMITGTEAWHPTHEDPKQKNVCLIRLHVDCWTKRMAVRLNM